ncbi:DEAD/DEAH box helicase [Patescibacteria group bacterium]|nr:DEAD/DEAH box helicase [Patescibacteria group bacterium]
MVGQSQTGTGKTAAFVIPLVNAIDPSKKQVQALVLCPTRELAVQTEEEFYKLSR